MSEDTSALLDLDGDTWAGLLGWSASTPLNSWRGVNEVFNGHVTKLRLEDLSPTSLTGSIPPQLGSLTNLTELSLRYNKLTGSIPPQLGSLFNLTHLDLSYNQLTGSIPPQLGSLFNLTRLVLAFNNLTGSIPWQLGSVTRLTQLSLSHNRLTGNIPPELGALTNLEGLWLKDNKLKGPIPQQLGRPINLVGLDLSINYLSGAIPDLSGLRRLKWLHLSENLLSEAIPRVLGKLELLEYLCLDNNNFTGPVPPELSELASLTTIDLTENAQLTGAPSYKLELKEEIRTWQRTLASTRTAPPPSAPVHAAADGGSSVGKDGTSTFFQELFRFSTSDHAEYMIGRLEDRIASLLELKLFISLASAAARHGEISVARRNELVLRALLPAARALLRDEASAAMFRSILHKAKASLMVTRDEFDRLEAGMISTMVGNYPVARQIQDDLREHRAAILDLQRLLEAPARRRRLDEDGRSLDEHGTAIADTREAMHATQQALKDFRLAYQTRQTRNRSLSFVKLAVNLFTVGVGGAAIDAAKPIIGSMLEKVVDFSDFVDIKGFLKEHDTVVDIDSKALLESVTPADAKKAAFVILDKAVAAVTPDPLPVLADGGKALDEASTAQAQDRMAATVLLAVAAVVLWQ